jgi:hypothetical protein
MQGNSLLAIDAVINLVLAVLLLTFPRSLVAFLGVPAVENAFYPSILGAVLFGIGAALLVERFRPAWGGLGLGGAVAINLSGALALAGWLLAGELALPMRGYIFLWALVVSLIVISLVEVMARRERSKGNG